MTAIVEKLVAEEHHLEDIARAIEKTGAGTGPARPPLPRGKSGVTDRSEASARV